MANVHLLSEIEGTKASESSQSQIPLTPVTADSFQEKVRVVHGQLHGGSKVPHRRLDASLEARQLLHPGMSGRGEQVAFLAFTREASNIQKRLKSSSWSLDHFGMISDRRRASTFFSSFIEHHWSDIEAGLILRKQSFVFTKELVNRGPGANLNAQALAKMVSEMVDCVRLTIQGWVYEYQAGIITKEVFFDRLKKRTDSPQLDSRCAMHRNNEERKIRNMETKADLTCRRFMA